MGVLYATLEDVRDAPDSKESARNSGQIVRLLDAASRQIENLCARKFYPQTGTRYFDWPGPSIGTSWRLWLDENELISVTSLTAGGTTIASTDYYLEPVNSGPPYRWIEIDLSSSAAFASVSGTHQRSIVITGVWGYTADSESAGTLAEALDDSETGVDVSNSAAIGVGSVIKVDSERMLVTAKSMLTTGDTTQASLSAAAATVTVAVTSGANFTVGEIILIDSERMLIVDISGNNLTVQRAVDGTTLASHNSGVTIYAPRTLTVTRGALGTTAASHNTSTAISKHVVPPLVRELAVAETVNMLQQDASAYARTVGSGETEREATGAGLKGLRELVRKSHGRRMRVRAVR